MKLSNYLPNWFTKSLKRIGASKPYRYKLVEDKPDNFDPYVIYVVGAKADPWQVAFSCPCGCGSVIELLTHNKARPRWKVNFINEKALTLYPSVRRITGCHSHFFLKKGTVVWCD